MKKLRKIMKKLRGENGCPWDREQDFDTLKPYVIEEAFEVVEAVDNLEINKQESIEELKKELGDLLLQVVFMSRIAEEKNLFSLDDVENAVSDKLVSRHPHVFSSKKVETAGEVLAEWSRIKKQKEGKKHLLDGIPFSMPAISVAKRYAERAATVGFDWSSPEEVLEKIDEESAELKEAVMQRNRDAVRHETGDLLFAVINCARKMGIDSEDALKRCARRFRERFELMEKMAPDLIDGKKSIDELEKLWQESKRRINKKGKNE
ncbi:MAG: nucleoside triphosphate pyrophosphohydrolase [bacterium]